MSKVEIELDETTKPWLRHYAQDWQKSLAEVATIFLQVHAKSWEFKKRFADEIERTGSPHDPVAAQIEDAQRAADEWFASCDGFSLETLTYAYCALGQELTRRKLAALVGQGAITEDVARRLGTTE